MFHKRALSLFMIFALLILSTLSFSSLSSAQTFSLVKVDDYWIDVGYSIDIEGNYAFIAESAGISIFDISNPSNVVYEHNIPLPSAPLGVQIKDGIAYVACSTSGFYIINVTDIGNPEILGHHNHTEWVTMVYVLDDLAFVSDYFSGLTIYDISNKSNPIDISYYYMSGNIWTTVAKGNIAYTANPDTGIEVLNITDPTTPYRFTILPSTTGVTHLSIYENTLYVGRHGSGLAIFDISSPSSPTPIGSYDDSDGGEELGLRGNETYLAVADNSGIELFDIKCLPTITKLDEYRQNVGAAHDVEMKGNYIYAVDGFSGFFVLRIDKQPVTPTTTSDFPIYTFLAVLAVTLLSTRRFNRKDKNYFYLTKNGKSTTKAFSELE